MTLEHTDQDDCAACAEVSDFANDMEALIGRIINMSRAGQDLDEADALAGCILAVAQIARQNGVVNATFARAAREVQALMSAELIDMKLATKARAENTLS